MARFIMINRMGLLSELAPKIRGQVLISICVLLITQGCQSQAPSKDGSKPPSHQIWTDLLQKFVDDDGFVDYSGFLKDSVKLNEYLNLLTQNPPDEQRWSDEQKLAYWINLYNAFTVKLIIIHYPLKSIRDIGSMIQIPFINSPWDIRFISIMGNDYDLNNVEHNILRKQFDESRIHFAINCASFSCPLLRREAYTAEKLEAQLQEQAVAFINDPARNKIDPDGAALSKIFNWFGGDFTKEGDLRDFINRYSKIKLDKKSKISYLKYDWSLNDQAAR